MATCKKWLNTFTIVCTNWAEQINESCTEWADEGSEECTQWEKCSWKPWTWHNCIAGFFCKAWYWVAKWVCRVLAYFLIFVCGVFSLFMNSICILWDYANCLLGTFTIFVRGLLSGVEGTKPKIEHVFVLMLENRSYDHMLGLSQIRGTDSVTGEIKMANGVDPNIHHNTNPTSGQDVYVASPAEYSLYGIDEDPGHSFGRTLIQLCGTGVQYPDPITGGYPAINNLGFIQSYQDQGSTDPDRIMKCFSKDQLPVMNKLAEEFAVCDNWFGSLPGPTSPNRFFLLAGTSGGLLANPKPGNISYEDIVSGIFGGLKFENGHIFDELDSKCVNWLIFSGDDFPNCIMMDGMAGEQADLINGRIKDTDTFNNAVNNPDFSEKFIFIEPKYNGGFEINPKVGDFTCGDSMHPLDDVTRGEKLIKHVYEVIRNSPHWNTSVLIITFDEHGGFYDHVAPPPCVPPGDIVAYSEDDIDFKFEQLGPRVPAIIVSPLIKKGTIDSKIYDHTTVLATIERLFGLNSLTERDRHANDLLHLFSLDKPRTDAPVTLPVVADSDLVCKQGELTEEELLLKVEAINVIQERALFEAKRDADDSLTDTDLGFAWSALLIVIHKMKYKERKYWVQEFQRITTGLDATKFRLTATLKTNFNKDLVMEKYAK